MPDHPDLAILQPLSKAGGRHESRGSRCQGSILAERSAKIMATARAMAVRFCRVARRLGIVRVFASSPRGECRPSHFSGQGEALVATMRSRRKRDRCLARHASDVAAMAERVANRRGQRPSAAALAGLLRREHLRAQRFQAPNAFRPSRWDRAGRPHTGRSRRDDPGRFVVELAGRTTPVS